LCLLVNRNLLALFTFSLIFFSIGNLWSQSESEKQVSLITILQDLEQQFDITFTYADNTIEGVKLNLLPENLSLNEVLDYLEKKTNLNFDAINTGSIVIRKQPDVIVQKPIKLQILNEVVITNYLTKGISKYNDGSIRLRPQEFGILPGLIEPDVLHTIQALPGIQSIDETVSNLNIRGGTHDQNSILWDGIKMYQSGHFFGLISAFNPYLTTDVVVTKNGTSAFYGDGVSSTINMLSNNEITSKLSAGAGSNLIHSDVFATIPLSNKTEMQISARRSLTDLISTPTYNEFFKRIAQDSDLSNNSPTTSISTNANFYFYDSSLKFLYDISKKDKLRLNFLTIFNKLDYQEDAISINTADNESLISELSQFNLAGSLSYNREWNSVFSTHLETYISSYDLNAINFDPINDQRLIQENEVIDLGLKITSKYRLLDYNTSINTGYQFSEIGIANLEDVNNPVFRRYIKEVVRTHAAFAEAQYKSESGKLYLSTGIRANYFQKFNKLVIEPRLSITQTLLSNLKLEVLGEFKSQTTSQIIDRQNDFLGIEKRRWILSNDQTIPVIKSRQASVGLHYYKNKLRINLEGYFKDVEGITTRSQGFQNQYQFVNAIGSYQVRGLDFLVNKQFKDISTWLSYTYSKNDYTFQSLNNGNPFPNNLDIRHAINFAGTYTYNNLRLALGINWRTGKPVTNPESNSPISSGDINYESPNSSNLKSYIRTDFSATYDFKLSKKVKAKAGISLWNILNQNNIINTYYTIDTDNSISKIDNQSLSITPNASFRVRF